MKLNPRFVKRALAFIGVAKLDSCFITVNEDGGAVRVTNDGAVLTIGVCDPNAEWVKVNPSTLRMASKTLGGGFPWDAQISTALRLESLGIVFASSDIDLSAKVPTRQDVKLRSQQHVPAGDGFREALRLAIPAMSQEYFRPILRSVVLRTVDGQASMYATDTHRLVKAPLGGEWKDQRDVVISSAIARFLAKCDAPFTIRVQEDGRVEAVGEGFHVTDLLGGSPPQFERVIPKRDLVNATARVKASSLHKALRSVSSVAKENARRCLLEIGDGPCGSLLASADGLIETIVPFDVEASSGAIRAAINWSFAASHLGLLGNEDVTIHFTNEHRALLIESSSCEFVVMPMAIDALEGRTGLPEREPLQRAA